MYRTESFNPSVAREAVEGALALQLSIRRGQILRASRRGLMMLATGMASGGFFWGLMLLQQYMAPSCHPFIC